MPDFVQPDYSRMLQEAGMPVTAGDMQARWDAINAEQGGRISNSSKWSPFWRLISAIVTEPCLDLVATLVNTALPNTFLVTSSGVWLDVFARGVDVERKRAVAAEGRVTFTRENATGELTVPAGTVIESPAIDGYVYRLSVTRETVCPDGTLVFDVPVRAQNPGTAYNLGPGYYSILPEPVPGTASAANGEDWLDTPGADEESDEELRLRCRNQFSAVGQYHHDAAYTALIASFAGIRTDYIYFEHGGPRGPGSANCYIMIESGAPSQAFVDRINAHVRDGGNHGHGDDLLCFPMPLAPVDLSVTVHPAPNLDADRRAELLAETGARIRCAFRENTDFPVTRTFPFSRFSFSRLSEELHAALPDLASVEFSHGNGSDEDIVSAMALPVLGTLTVNEGA